MVQNSQPPLARHPDLSESAPPLPPGRASLQLVGLAAVILLCLLFFGFVLPQTPGRMLRTSAALIAESPLWTYVVALPLPVPQGRSAIAVALLGTIAVAFAAYAAALRISWRRSIPPLVAAGPGLVFLLVSMFGLPNSNTDIFNYIMRGRVMAVYHSSPYEVPASRFPNDPLYAYASPRFTEWADGKLPAMELVSAGLARLAGNAPVANLLVFRLAFLLLSGASLLLLYRIARRLAPGWASFAVIGYSWNPIVAYFGPSKTDALMAFYLLLGVYLIVSGRRGWAMIPLMLSVLVKLITLPLVAIYWLRVLRRSRREALRDAAVGLLVALIAYLPYRPHPGLFFKHAGYMENAVTNSVGFDLVRVLGTAVFGAVVLWAGLRGRDTGRDLLRDWGWVLVVFALAVSRTELAWYLLVPIAVFSLASDWKLPVIGLPLAIFSFTLNMWRTTYSSGFTAPPVAKIARLGLPLLLLATLGLALLAMARARAAVHRRSA